MITSFFSTSIQAQLVANFTASPTAGCAPLLVSFDSNSSTGNPNSWLWDFGDGTGSSNLQSPQHVYSSPGQYSVTLTIGNNSTTNTILKSNFITVDGNPIFDFSQSDSGCVGETFNFLASTNSTSIQSYAWNFGDGSGNILTTNPSTSHQYNTIGSFNLNLTLTTTNGCTSTLTKNNFILVGTQPISNITLSPLTICFGDIVQFNSLTPQPVTGWQWYFGDGATSISENPNHQYNLDTSSVSDPFDVTLISYYNGCPDTFSQPNLITVNSPISNFSYATDSLTPYTITFTNESGGADSYLWDFGDSSPISNDVNPVHNYSSFGTYIVTLTATNFSTGCTIDSSISIIIPISTEINEINSNDVVLYPNPIINILSVKCNAVQSNLILKITDVVGKELTKLNFCPHSTECQVDLSEYSKGLYWIEVISQDDRMIFKNIVIKL